jgi:hypothetical protein
MARYTSVEQLQKHLEIDYAEEGDRDYLGLLLDASESRIEKEINQPLTEFVDDAGNLDSALVAAILIFAGTLYANREVVAYTNAVPVPYTLGFLLQPFRKYS